MEKKEYLLRIKDAHWTDEVLTEDEDGDAIHQEGIILELVMEGSGKVVHSYISADQYAEQIGHSGQLGTKALHDICEALSASKALVKTVYDPSQVALTPEMIGVVPLSEEESPAHQMRVFADAYDVAQDTPTKLDALQNLVDLADTVMADLVGQEQRKFLEATQHASRRPAGPRRRRRGPASVPTATATKSAPKNAARRPAAKKSAAKAGA